MDTTSILADLRAERDRINQAISALETFGGSATASKSKKTGRRHMSAAARRKISEAQKKRWAKQKGNSPAAKQAAPKRKKGGISAAGRKRISEMMKKRWAAKKKAGQ